MVIYQAIEVSFEKYIALELWFTMGKIWFCGKNYDTMKKNYGTIVNYR